MAKIEVSSYQGKPILVFKDDDNDRYPFSFGAGKAKKLLAAIDEHGVEHVVKVLRTLCSSQSKS